MSAQSSEQAPLPAGTNQLGSVTTSGTAGTLQDVSGSIAAANTSQPVCAANAARYYFFFQNNSAGALGLNFTSPATLGGGSIQVPAGGSFVMESSFISVEEITVIGATLGQAYTAKEG